jgi:3-oxoacyl-(acyl-carrier-protein) synthase
VIRVRGTAMWTAERGAPKAELIPAAARRRCSLGTRLVAEVTADLVAVGLPIASAAIVHGTAFGEIVTTAALLDMMQEGTGELSPLRFAGSVHNTAPAQLAIALGLGGWSTTVSAGHHTFATAWLEAHALLATGTTDVLLVVADEPMPTTMQPHHDGFAAALWLSTSGEGPAAQWLGTIRDAPQPARVPAILHDHPLRFAWSLIEAVRAGSSARVRIGPDDARSCAPVLAIA